MTLHSLFSVGVTLHPSITAIWIKTRAKHRAQTSQLLPVQFSSVQSFSPVQLFVTPWTAACQASLSITNSQSLFKLMSIESVMPSNHVILCHPLLLLPSISPSIRVFSNESVLCIWWPTYWIFSFSIQRRQWHPTLAWKIPWMEKPGRLQSMGSQRVRHD